MDLTAAQIHRSATALHLVAMGSLTALTIPMRRTVLTVREHLNLHQNPFSTFWFANTLLHVSETNVVPDKECASGYAKCPNSACAQRRDICCSTYRRDCIRLDLGAPLSAMKKILIYASGRHLWSLNLADDKKEFLHRDGTDYG